jgi:hypothetical protein
VKLRRLKIWAHLEWNASYYHQAAGCYAQIEKFAPGDIEALWEYCQVVQLLGDSGEVRRLLQRIEDNQPDFLLRIRTQGAIHLT